jgi:hypothetical protein
VLAAGRRWVPVAGNLYRWPSTLPFGRAPVGSGRTSAAFKGRSRVSGNSDARDSGNDAPSAHPCGRIRPGPSHHPGMDSGRAPESGRRPQEQPYPKTEARKRIKMKRCVRHLGAVTDASSACGRSVLQALHARCARFGQYALAGRSLREPARPRAEHKAPHFWPRRIDASHPCHCQPSGC